jgi:hypothetical protein
MDESASLHRAYYEAVRVALLQEWDPIGVKHLFEASDEYDCCVSGVVRLLIDRKSENEIFDSLWHLETDHMGLHGDRPATSRFAKRLMEIQQKIDSEH